MNLLGTCKQEDGSSVPAVLLLEKTAYSKAFVDALGAQSEDTFTPVSYTHLRAHET